MTTADRIRGCLLGGAIGDALGAGIEFASLAQIRASYGPQGVDGFVPAYGQPNAITDDTQMTLFTVTALLENPETELASRLWRNYQAWARHQSRASRAQHHAAYNDLETHPAMTAVRAPGNACLSGLASRRPGTRATPANPNSKGCGAVMRAAPFGLAAASPEHAWQDAITGSVLTHGHPSGYLPAAALAWIVRTLLDGAALPEAVHSAIDRATQAGPDAAETVTALRAAQILAAQPPFTPEKLQSLGGGWTGEQALAIAVYAATAHRHPNGRNDVHAALLGAVNHSGDSDSTGAICGNLLGAAHGQHALPVQWTHAVEARDLVLDLADRLTNSAQFFRA